MYLRALIVTLLSLSLACTADERAPRGAASDDDVGNNLDVANGTPSEDTSLSDTPRIPPTPDPTPEQAIEVTELAPSKHTATNGITTPWTVTVPPDAISLSITAWGSPGVHYVLDSVRAPDGTYPVLDTWYVFGNPTMCLLCLNRVSASETVNGSLIPNTPTVSLLPGEYSFRFYAFRIVGSGQDSAAVPAEGQVTPIVTIKRNPTGPPVTGVLDLNLHFTGSDGLTATTAPTNPRLQGALKQMTDIYAWVGVSIGNVTYHDISPQFQVIDQFNGPGNDFESLAMYTEGSPPGINLIFVRKLIDSKSPAGTFGIIFGISGGIPGPTGVQGTSRSAVLIATEIPQILTLSGIPDHLGATMAHETGHFLGLFHTTEAGFGQMQLHDQIPDTPENDPSNLMYYESTEGGTNLTSDQGYVIRNNPWIRFSQ